MLGNVSLCLQRHALYLFSCGDVGKGPDVVPIRAGAGAGAGTGSRSRSR